MVANELLDILNRYRTEGIIITDAEAENIRKHCIRKMEVAKVQNPEEYLPLLYEDEIKNYLIRRVVNTETILRIIGGGNSDVRCM